jgi:cytoskeleton protein RodZ
MPQTIGDTLREARMRQKIDITEIEAKTKIRAKYLRAMENEEFDLLPGSTFAKSFLRTYADALGLDAHRLVEEYRSQYEPRDDSDLPPLSSHQGAARRRSGRYDRQPPPRRTAALIAAALLVIAVLVVIGIVGGNNKGKPKAAVTSTTTTTTSSKRKKTGTTPTRTATPTTVLVRVSPSVPTYVCADRGTGTSPTFEGIISKAKSFRGRHVRLNLGKTSVTVTANGQRVPLTAGPNPIGLDFTPRRHKVIPSGTTRPCG